MELRTIEVRWFSPGPCPRQVADWFHAGRMVSEPERRTDEYLALPGRLDLGVKRRGGTVLDVKLRTGSMGDSDLPEGFNGRVESWIKWSFPLDAGEPAPFDGPWIPVEKVRCSRLYEVTSDAAARAVPAGSELGAGCAAELVEVRIDRHESWGFGFEAFGDAHDLNTVLGVAARATVADTPLEDLAFPRTNSHSYPAWLSRWPEPRG